VGKKKVAQGPNSRGSDAMRGFKQDRDGGSNVPDDSLSRRNGSGSGGSSSAKMLADQQDLGREWSGVEWVLEMRIVVELCCTVLCSALATVGDLRRGPCWYRIGWWWARHRPPKLSWLAESLSRSPPKLPPSLSP
jgi:hypothetical protein